MDKVSYSFVKNEEAELMLRSKVNSFNLDHVIDKDIVSFYTSFSNYAHFDTGLLPVDGTGLLSIRKAGTHTQIAYQYKPGMYYVNWGAREGDKDFVKYYLAQPYRIVIIDFIENNLLGARTFYTLEPAYHSNVQLYHVNLPNINCCGYKGTGVGWICLYHNQDWSKLPFNERLIKALERCSGVEIYNDGNMSETDGPRFYAKNNYPDYIYDPLLWQEKSVQEGFEWTLNADNWIPIKVQDRNNQTAHIIGGYPLLLIDAIVGTYNAYYTDPVQPKPVNSLMVENIKGFSKHVTDWFIRAYNNSKTIFTGIDPYLESSQIKEKVSLEKLSLPFDEDDNSDESQDDDEENHHDDEDQLSFVCPFKNQAVHPNDCGPELNFEYLLAGADFPILICSDCVDSNNIPVAENTGWAYDETMAKEFLYYDPNTKLYWDVEQLQCLYAICSKCGYFHIASGPEGFNIWSESSVGSHVNVVDSDNICSNCAHLDTNTIDCYRCGTNMPAPDSTYFDSSKIKQVSELSVSSENGNDQLTVNYLCNGCSFELSKIEQFSKEPSKEPKEITPILLNSSESISSLLQKISQLSEQTSSTNIEKFF